MDTRRDFLKKAMVLSGAAGWTTLLPESVARALAIEPEPGGSYLDAEHIVVLMQENRSFDHCFGTLKGVRGFNDPRRIDLPDGSPVWLQRNAEGETYVPFRFDIHDTRITWMGSVPHSRHSQVDAYNHGRYDQWLDSKKSATKTYAGMPLTLGYYTREDIPFNYALADAFTVCDQNFSSAMTSTWPNRLYLWSGTIRGDKDGKPNVIIRNDIPWGDASWQTFPEILEEHGVSWKVYQNDLTAGGGFAGEQRAWLANFGCNILEQFTQYGVRFSSRYVAGLRQRKEEMTRDIATLRSQLEDPAADPAKLDPLRKILAKKQGILDEADRELALWNEENFQALSRTAGNLHEKAFTINSGDPDFRNLTSFTYEENGTPREMKMPKGDILHQFREDVDGGKLPAVSWLVAPEKFTDHPQSPWFGSWYVSEILDILTHDPEVWKKTIFILTYDENDGYFDHVPPFVAPDPTRPETGKCSPGIDTSGEYVRIDDELRRGVPAKEAREGPIGLGFRVPMIVASPWTRGGRVCSHVFDHTSVFRFIEKFFSEKTGVKMEESNVTEWRKVVTGDLGLVFRPAIPGSEKLPLLEKLPFMESIHNAKFKSVPGNYHLLTPEDVVRSSAEPDVLPWMPRQEPGVKQSCALPYELYAECGLTPDRNSVTVEMTAGKEVFSESASGSPFNLYLPGLTTAAPEKDQPAEFVEAASRSYAVRAGDRLTDSWPLDRFQDGRYQVKIHGPNGFYREAAGNATDPDLSIRCFYGGGDKPTGKLRIEVSSRDKENTFTVTITDRSYGGAPATLQIPASEAGGTLRSLILDREQSHGWYDYEIHVEGHDTFNRRYAGRIETGKDSLTDPFMGRVPTPA